MRISTQNNEEPEKEFTKIKEKDIDRIWAEEAYLEDIVKLNHSELSVFEELLSIFAETFQELFKKETEHMKSAL